ncbi:spore germination protein PB [Bacillus pakistanensis]|uniref:Spore germination protein PB n=1 Tax=Rossellomorea pakistanensis TaxID=992288 RepID=A0ABS2NF58_9BACI|nr:spore germination protein GerPB [Bacillus pakistanensis]MBM7586477.1 spore germination protein PB [Bacillus pakistanensis]
MKLFVQQSIHIHMIKIEGMSNSSVLQIGTSGKIQSAAYLYNTGGFEAPAPEAKKNGEDVQAPDVQPLVPLQSPTPG